MGRTWKDQKSEKRKPTKKERRELEKLKDIPGRDAVRRPAEWKSSYRKLKIEE